MLDFSSSEELKQPTMDAVDKPEIELLINMSNEIKGKSGNYLEIKHMMKNQKT